jgi:polar amino acid transport system substrate-binding protein
MSDIFISYKREEQPVARKLADGLQKKGWSVWWDPEVRAGERFDDVIEKALIESKCVVVLWSKLSVNSQNVKDEATYALNRDKLVPIVIEELELPFRFERINTGQLIDWDGSDNFPGFQKLLDDIVSILGEPPAEEEKRKQEQAEREAERKRREDEQRKTEEERQRLEEENQRLAEQKREFEEAQKHIEAARKVEEERKQKDAETKHKADEETRRKEREELKQKAEEEKKREKAEAKRKLDEEFKLKETDFKVRSQVKMPDAPHKPATTEMLTTETVKDDAEIADTKPFKQKPSLEKTSKNIPVAKIGILIVFLIVIGFGVTFFLLQTPFKSTTEVSTPTIQKEHRNLTTQPELSKKSSKTSTFVDFKHKSHKIQSILERGDLRVGLLPTPIFTMPDKEGKFIGFDIDMAKELSKEMGVAFTPVDLSSTEFSTIVARLLTDEFDIIISGAMVMTPEREKRIVFSEPYFINGKKILLNKKHKKDLLSFEDFNNQRYVISYLSGTTSESVANTLLPQSNHKSFESYDEVIQSVLSGKSDGMVADLNLCIAIQASYGKDKLIMLDDTITEEPVGFVLRKGHPVFLDWLNSFLKIIKKDGRYDRIYQKWFKNTDWIKK